MKHKKITEMEVEDIRREQQESQRSRLEEREEEELEHSGTIRMVNRRRTQHLQQKKKRKFKNKGIRFTN